MAQAPLWSSGSTPYPHSYIKFKKPSDWQQWWAQTVSFVELLDVWGYVNPNKSEDNELSLQRPREPEVDDMVEPSRRGHVSFTTLSKNERETYLLLYKIYETKLREYQRTTENLGKFKLYLLETVELLPLYDNWNVFQSPTANSLLSKIIEGLDELENEP
jgi:hypothetical protein